MFNKKNKASFYNYFPLLLLIFSLVVLSSGCEKKAEKPEGEKTSSDTTSMVGSEKSKKDTTVMADTTKMYPDLTGTWTGKFDSRATTFKITEQTKDSFKGHMIISYKKPLDKDISGNINLKMQITMKDLTHSRFMGKYSGTLSSDGKKMSGGFTMNADNSKYNFTFSKK
jgi:hypothetical protein